MVYSSLSMEEIFDFAEPISTNIAFFTSIIMYFNRSISIKSANATLNIISLLNFMTNRIFFFLWFFDNIFCNI